MSNVSLKKDYTDGRPLYGAQLNASNKAAENAINDNFKRIKELDKNATIALEELEAVVNTKASLEYVESIDNELQTKASLEEVATKADKTEVAALDAKVETKQDKGNYALKEEIPTNISELYNDRAFISEDDIKDDYAKKTEIPTKVSELTNDEGYITGYTETDPTVPSHVKNITNADITKWNNKSDFSGRYADLEGLPTIPETDNNYTDSDKAKVDTLVTDGEGENYLADDGTYKPVQSGSNYTAGTNIEITEENVINNTIPYKEEKNSDNLTRMVLGDNTPINFHCIAIGNMGNASGTNIVKVGHYSSITNDYTTAIGNDTGVAGRYGVAVGGNAHADGQSSVSLGHQAYAYKKNSITIGKSAISNFADSIALGYSAHTTKENQMVIGSTNSKINEIDIYTDDGLKPLATQEYVDEHGGGSSYTAGTNIEITEENVINSMPDYDTSFGSGNMCIVPNDENLTKSEQEGCTYIGQDITADDSYYTTAIGAFTEVEGDGAIAIGALSGAHEETSIALGVGAHTEKPNQMMIGGHRSEINEVCIYTRTGIKTLATTEDITNAIGNIETALDTIINGGAE